MPCVRRERELSSFVPVCSKAPPKFIQKVLLIDPLFCFGDALFVNGLINYLQNKGITVGLITFPRLFSIYNSINHNLMYRIDDPTSFESALRQQWDIAVDLCYMFNQRWDYRKAIISKLTQYTLICDRIIGTSSFKDIYSEYLDISNCRHFGDRLARIAGRIVGTEVGTIRPYVRTASSQNSSNGKYVYVNTVGGTTFRCLSQKQVNLIAETFNKKAIQAYFYCANNISLEETEYVRKVYPRSFADCLQVIAGAQAIISPDTSVVHAASAFDKPLLAFYCENDPEHYGLTMKEVWAPLSSQNIVLTPKVRGIHRVPISEITDKQMFFGLDRFFQFLNQTL